MTTINRITTTAATTAVLALMTACVEESNLLPIEERTPVVLSDVSIGTQTRAALDKGSLYFTKEDTVVVTATATSSAVVSNTFIYNGYTWAQGGLSEKYTPLYKEDIVSIDAVVSHGGRTTALESKDQSTLERYMQSDRLEATILDNGSVNPALGKFNYIQGNLSANLTHANSDLVINIRDGEDAASVLGSDAQLRLTVSRDEYTMYKEGKQVSTTGFRIILPPGSVPTRGLLTYTAGNKQYELGITISGLPTFKPNTRYTATLTCTGKSTMEISGFDISDFTTEGEFDITTGNEKK